MNFLFLCWGFAEKEGVYLRLSLLKFCCHSTAPLSSRLGCEVMHHIVNRWNLKKRDVSLNGIILACHYIQGLTPGPNSFALMLDVDHIVGQHDILFHSHADSTQLSLYCISKQPVFFFYIILKIHLPFEDRTHRSWAQFVFSHYTLCVASVKEHVGIVFHSVGQLCHFNTNVHAYVTSCWWRTTD